MPNNRKYQNRAIKGHFASLSPEGQVIKIVSDVKDLKNGHDLRSWSASARKELKAAPSISFHVGTGEIKTINVPKLAMIIASPPVRQYFQKNPSATSAKFVHADINPRAVQLIAEWLEKACNEQTFPKLDIPDKIEEAHNLRLTAYTLGMERYFKHFEVHYLVDVRNRVPAIDELIMAVKYARETDDAILVGLANRVAYLRRHRKISDDEETAYADLLEDGKYRCLVDTINIKKVRGMAHQGGN